MRRKMGWVLALSVVLCVAGVAGVVAAPEVEPNDAAPQAVGTLPSRTTTLSVEGASGYAGDLDWYSFVVVDEAQTVLLAADSATSWQIVLYSESLTHIASGTNSLTEELATGSYRVRIQETTLGRDRYTLLLSNAVEQESNDGLAEATSLGVLQTQSLVAFASIRPVSDVDFFSFDVPDDASFAAAAGFERIVRIETPCPTGDTLVLLYAVDEALGYAVPITRNDDSGDGSWSRLYLVNPAPGRYTLRVHEYADNESIAGYRVAVTPLEIVAAEPNDVPSRATALGELREGERLEATQFVAEDDTDAFSFTLASSACVLIETSGASEGNSMLCLLDQDLREVACDNDGGSGAWSRLFRSLDAGRYTVLVSAPDAAESFDYTLSLTTAACPADVSESESNDTLASANPIVLPSDVSAEVSPNSPDLFRFTLAAPAVVTAETYGDTDGDTTVCILDAAGDRIVCDDDGGAGLWSQAAFSLDPGTYFVKVELYAGVEPQAYHLLVRSEE